VRFAFPLLAALALFTLVACGGEDDAETADPAPLAQRVLTEEDAPGSKSDPVETRQTTVDFDEFVEALGNLAIDPDTEELTGVFEGAGFEGAITETRFFGEMHARTAPHVSGSVIQLQSEEGATSAVDWLEADVMKPCPKTCAVQISAFEVDDIPDACGVHRSASVEDIEAVGNDDERPFDAYWVGFTDGSFVYTVDLHGPPGSVSEQQAVDIASALHHRVGALSS